MGTAAVTPDEYRVLVQAQVEVLKSRLGCDANLNEAQMAAFDAGVMTTIAASISVFYEKGSHEGE